MVRLFLEYHYGVTGRFDQKTVDAQNPLPTFANDGLSTLCIIAEMISNYQQNPAAAIKDVDLALADVRKPWVAGRPWCEYEKACLIQEMAALKRQNGLPENCKINWTVYVSGQLNQKYGIGREGHSIRMIWARCLRERTGIDERGNFRNDGREYGAALKTSINKTTHKKRSSKAQKSTTKVAPKSSIQTPSKVPAKADVLKPNTPKMIVKLQLSSDDMTRAIGKKAIRRK